MKKQIVLKLNKVIPKSKILDGRYNIIYSNDQDIQSQSNDVKEYIKNLKNIVIVPPYKEVKLTTNI